MKKVLSVLFMMVVLLGSFSFSGKMNTAKAASEGFFSGKEYENGGLSGLAEQPIQKNWSFNSPYEGTKSNELFYKRESNTKKIINSFVIDKDETVITSEGTPSTIVAYKKDGSVKWKYESTAVSGISSLLLTSKNTLYFQEYSKIVSLNPEDGKVIWSTNTDANGLDSFVDKEGAVYVTNAHMLRVYNPDGSLKWYASLDGNIRAQVKIDKEGKIYATTDKSVYALDKNGKTLWNTKIKYFTSSVLELAPNNKLMYTEKKGDDYILFVLDRNTGEVLKEFKLPGIPLGITVSDLDGSIYFSGAELTVYDQDFNIKWKYQKPQYPKLLLDKNNNAFFADNNGNTIISLSPDGKVRWQYEQKDEVINYWTTPLSMDRNGKIYIAARQGKDIYSLNKFSLTVIGDDSEPKPKPEEDICLKPSVCKEINTFINNAYNFRAGDYEFKHEQFYDIDKCRNKIVFQFDGDDPKILEQKARHRGDIEHWMNKEGLSTKDMTFIWKDVKNDKILLEEKPSSK